MEVIFFLLPICIVIAGGFVFGFIWMTKDGQYDDFDTPANRILLDDKKINVDIQPNINPSIRLNKERK